MTATVETIGQILRAENHLLIERDVDAVFSFLVGESVDALWHEAGSVEVIEARRPHELRFRVVDGRTTTHGRYTLIGRPDATTVVSLALEVEPRGFSRLLRPLTARALMGEVSRLWRVKALVEA